MHIWQSCCTITGTLFSLLSYSLQFMQGLGSAVRYKAYKKRPLRSTRLTFGSDFSIGVQLFATIKVPATAVLHAILCCCIFSA